MFAINYLFGKKDLVQKTEDNDVKISDKINKKNVTDNSNDLSLIYINVVEELKKGIRKPSEYKRPCKNLLNFEIKISVNSSNHKLHEKYFEYKSNESVDKSNEFVDKLMKMVERLENITRKKNKVAEDLFNELIEQKDVILENKELQENLHDRLNDMIENDKVFPWHYNQPESQKVDFIYKSR